MNTSLVSSRRILALVGLLACSGTGILGCRADAVPAAPMADVTTLAIPNWTNVGPEREVEVLHEADGLKIAAIALRRGTSLPTHSVDSKVSIEVVRGAGVVNVDGSEIAVDAGSVLVLAPAVAHAMTPADDELVVLLVHHFDARNSASTPNH